MFTHKIEVGEELKQQYVRYEIIAGLSPDLLVSLAEARNTSAQVKEFALDNLAKKFEWLKEFRISNFLYVRIASLHFLIEIGNSQSAIRNPQFLIGFKVAPEDASLVVIVMLLPSIPSPFP